jgi:hypothetical protein
MENVDPKELEMGMSVEKEHTQDEALARKIAMDHLAEDPKYYTKLKAAGLEECGDMDSPTVAVVTLAAPVGPEVAAQKPLKSSGLGSGAPKPLSSTNLTAPETKVINDKNTVTYTKTPVLTSTCDPTAHFLGSIDQDIQEKW